MTIAAKTQTELSIVIPAYNEALRLPATLQAVISYLDRSSWKTWEVVVVDDGSRDHTAEIVREAEGLDARIRLVQNPGNRGKGYSVRAGLQAARGEWRLSTDADLSTPIDELDRLVEVARLQRAGVVIGSRALDRSLVSVRQSPFREASGKVFNLCMRMVTGLPFQDTQCGFKLYRAEAAKVICERQSMEGFSFDVEHLVIAAGLGITVVEVPVRWANVIGTKVSAWSGIRSFADLLRIRGRAIFACYR